MDSTITQMSNALQQQAAQNPTAPAQVTTAQAAIATCDKTIRDRGRYGIAAGAALGGAAAYGAYKTTGHWGWGLLGWLVGCGVGTAVNAMLPEPACVADVAPLRQQQ